MNRRENSEYSSKPTIEEIEWLLISYRAEPGPGFQAKSWDKDFADPQAPGPFSHTLWRQRLLIGIIVLSFLVPMSPLRNTIAQSISSFFRFSNRTERIETISFTPRPSPNPEYTYSEFTLSKDQAETQAGFNVKSLPSLRDATGWQFHNYKYDAQLDSVQQLYTYSSKEEPGIYLYLTIQSGPFESDWGFCPNGTLFEAEVNGLPAEILSGAVWITATKATPGVEQEWQCEAVDNLSVLLRWNEDDLYYEINVAQFETLSDILFEHQDLIDFAEELK